MQRIGFKHIVQQAEKVMTNPWISHDILLPRIGIKPLLNWGYIISFGIGRVVSAMQRLCNTSKNDMPKIILWYTVRSPRCDFKMNTIMARDPINDNNAEHVMMIITVELAIIVSTRARGSFLKDSYALSYVVWLKIILLQIDQPAELGNVGYCLWYAAMPLCQYWDL